VTGGFAAPTHLDHVVFVKDLAGVLPALEAMPSGPVEEKQLDRL
jgi:hypothetical protein